MQPFDLNRDGIDELFVQHPDQQSDLVDSELNLYYRSFKISGNRMYAVQPIPTAVQDSLAFLATYGTQDSLVCRILPPPPLTIGMAIDEKFLRDFVVFHRNPDTPESSFHPSIGAVTLITDSSGQNLALFIINTSWDTNGVRGLLAADIHSRKVVWQYLIGPSVGNILVSDLDGDNKAEIVVGSYANCNGIKGLDTADDSSYVFVLDCDGRLRWQRAVGPYWTGAWAGVGDFQGNGSKSIAVYQYSNRESFPNQDRIQILDARDGSLLVEKRHGNQFTTFVGDFQRQFCRDFDGDGKDEIVMGNTDGFVRLLDGKLIEQRVSKAYQQRVAAAAAEDFDGDGLHETVCILPNEQIILLDSQLQELCRWPITAPASQTYVQVVHGGKKNHLLVISEFPDHKEYQLLECQTSPFPFPAVSMAAKSSPWIAIVLLLFIAGLIIRNWFYGERARAILPSVLEEADVMHRVVLIDRQGRIAKAGHTWAELLRLPPRAITGKTWREAFSAPQLEPLKRALDDTLRQALSETLVDFSIVAGENRIPLKLHAVYLPSVRMYCLMIFDSNEEEQARQIKHWAQAAQKLAHSIKNPLTTVKLCAEEMRVQLKEKYRIEEGELDELFEQMTTQVTKLKRLNDAFMRFVEFEKPQLLPVDLNDEVKELVLQWQPERSSNIHIHWELGDNLPHALIDREQFGHAFRNVFFNAIESLKAGGRILISTQTVQLFSEEGHFHPAAVYVELQLRDTGCRIPPEYLDKVTQPWFTLNKPEGSGLGLSIVQKVMDSHGGKLDIQSEVGRGTTVTLWFRAKNES
ncbi:MAG: ATP-binding protein [candidate division KSB1 bacterium]|nr:ATP-binding protein [candidate division KSB1 bacterium]